MEAMMILKLWLLSHYQRFILFVKVDYILNTESIL